MVSPFVYGTLYTANHDRTWFVSWEEQYRQKVRDEVLRRELDAEVRRLRGLGRRFDAFKAVRRADDGLTPAEARRVVDALDAGLEPPEDLAARLPQPDRGPSALVVAPTTVVAAMTAQA